MATEKMYTVGVIIGTHGLKGEVKIFPRTDYPELRFVTGSKLYLVHSEAKLEEIIVKSARMQNRVYVVSFDGFTNIDQVAALRGKELKVFASQTPQLAEWEYWVDDLIGCTVYTETGETLGILTDVLTPGANDVYVVMTEDNNQLLLPAIPDCVLDVNVAEKSIKVHILPGLLD